jgi:hypothetical protein
MSKIATYFGLLLALSVTVTSTAARAMSECFVNTRDEAVAKVPTIPTKMLQFLNLNQQQVESLKRQREEFLRRTNPKDAGATSLEYDYDLSTNRGTLSIDFTFEKGEKYASNLDFVMKLDMTLDDSQDHLVAETSTTTHYLKSCETLPNGFEELNVPHYKDSDGTAIIQWRHQDDANQKIESGVTKVNAIRLTNSQMLNSVRLIKSLEDGRIKPNQIFTEVDPEVPFNEVSYSFGNMTQVKRKSLVTGKLEDLHGITFKATISSPSLELHGTAFMNDDGSGTVIGKLIGQDFLEESLSKDLFRSQEVVSSSQEETEVKGLSADDFGQGRLVLIVNGGPKKLAFSPTAPTYFQLDGHRLIFSRQVLPPPALMTMPPSPEDQVYLKSTSAIEVDKVARIADTITFLGNTRYDLAKAIGRKVRELITYDENMLENDTVGLLTTTEIIAAKKGVCQHFANLFVALARARGLPARIMGGYGVDSEEVFGHAWVEIKINNNEWYPIEPQADPDALGTYGLAPNIAYLPFMSMAQYELQTKDPTLYQKQLFQMNERFVKYARQIDGTIITKGK